MIWSVAGVTRFLPGEDLRDLRRLGGIVVASVIVDVLTRATASVEYGTAPGPLLLWRAFAANPVPVLLLAVGLGAVWRFGRGSLAAGWSTIDRGHVLRGLALPLVPSTEIERAESDAIGSTR